MLDVCADLGVQPVPTDIAAAVAWAGRHGRTLPVAYLDGVAQGAAHWLTECSNMEEFSLPWQSTDSSDSVYPGPDGTPLLPLLWENQAVYVFSLALTSDADPPVVVQWREDYERCVAGAPAPPPVRYTETFTQFVWSRVFDFQYLWYPGSRWPDVDGSLFFFHEVPAGREGDLESALVAAGFEQLMSSPLAHEPTMERRRYRRGNQRVGAYGGLYELSAATEHEFTRLHDWFVSTSVALA